MTKIILERHGQSIGNAEGLYLGHTDLGLTELGREQAMLTAEHLKDERIDKIYSSDLKRAYETALAHAKIRNTEVIRRKGLREMYVGDWEGRLVSELLSECYEAFKIRRTFRDFVYPGGEGVFEAYQRLRDELLKICEENEGKTVLVVCHSAVIRAFWYFLHGYAEENMKERVEDIKNAAYSVITCEDGVLTPISHNNYSHLLKNKTHTPT